MSPPPPPPPPPRPHQQHQKSRPGQGNNQRTISADPMIQPHSSYGQPHVSNQYSQGANSYGNKNRQKDENKDDKRYQQQLSLGSNNNKKRLNGPRASAKGNVPFYCDVCKIEMTCEANYADHLKGKRHTTNLRQKNMEKQNDSLGFKLDFIPPPPPPPSSTTPASADSKPDQKKTTSSVKPPASSNKTGPASSSSSAPFPGRPTTTSVYPPPTALPPDPYLPAPQPTQPPNLRSKSTPVQAKQSQPASSVYPPTVAAPAPASTFTSNRSNPALVNSTAKQVERDALFGPAKSVEPYPPIVEAPRASGSITHSKPSETFPPTLTSPLPAPAPIETFPPTAPLVPTTAPKETFPPSASLPSSSTSAKETFPPTHEVPSAETPTPTKPPASVSTKPKETFPPSDPFLPLPSEETFPPTEPLAPQPVEHSNKEIAAPAPAPTKTVPSNSEAVDSKEPEETFPPTVHPTVTKPTNPLDASISLPSSKPNETLNPSTEQSKTKPVETFPPSIPLASTAQPKETPTQKNASAPAMDAMESSSSIPSVPSQSGKANVKATPPPGSTPSANMTNVLPAATNITTTVQPIPPSTLTPSLASNTLPSAIENKHTSSLIASEATTPTDISIGTPTSISSPVNKISTAGATGASPPTPSFASKAVNEAKGVEPNSVFLHDVPENISEATIEQALRNMNYTPISILPCATQTGSRLLTMPTKSDCDKLLSAQFLQLGDSVKLRVSLQPQPSSQPQAKTPSKTLPDASPSQPLPTSVSAPTPVSKQSMKDSEISLQGPLPATKETAALPSSSASSGTAVQHQQSENVPKTTDSVSSTHKPPTASGNDSMHSLGDQQPTRQTEKKRRREENITSGMLTSGGNDAEAKSSDDSDLSRPAVRQKTSHPVDALTPAKTSKSADTEMDCSNSPLQSAMKPDSLPAESFSGNTTEIMVAMKSSSSPVVNAKQISTAAPSTTVSSVPTPSISKSKPPLSTASTTVIPPSTPAGAPAPEDIETSTVRASPSGAVGTVSGPAPPSTSISIPASVPLSAVSTTASAPSTPSPGAISTERLFPNGRILPKDHLSQPITKSELRELRHWVFDKGTDVEQLAFKMLQELILSPILGMREDYLGPLNSALMKDMADQYAVPHEGVFARFSDVRKVFNGPKKEFAEGNEDWMKKQTKEQLAVSLFEENLEFLFKPFQPGENNGKQSLDCLPTRGTFGSRSLDRTRSDGVQQTRYQDKVSEDNLFNILSAYMFKKDIPNIRTTEPHSDF